MLIPREKFFCEWRHRWPDEFHAAGWPCCSHACGGLGGVVRFGHPLADGFGWEPASLTVGALFGRAVRGWGTHSLTLGVLF
jgi:hypothetical protein